MNKGMEGGRGTQGRQRGGCLLEQGQLVAKGCCAQALEPTLQALGAPSEGGLGAWERLAEKRTSRTAGGKRVRMDRRGHGTGLGRPQ